NYFSRSFQLPSFKFFQTSSPSFSQPKVSRVICFKVSFFFFNLTVAPLQWFLGLGFAQDVNFSSSSSHRFYQIIRLQE
ncbi:hypothetical protein F8388_020585, partial [Cannabis sativa]